jgi:alkanesulfonate monooxygenase SsuD/methylene tetrahydromethanopterin reductase-like flavin-dependent oxidoreductase (luciferase family)
MIGFGFFVQDVPTALDQVERAERAGVDCAWIVMPPLGWDGPTLAAAALARTERIRVGTSIVPMFTRHPLALATQVAALAGVAPDRFRLGVGTGNLGLMADAYGTPVTRPVDRTREYLEVLRPALAEGTVSRMGTFYDVDAALLAGPVPTGSASWPRTRTSFSCPSSRRPPAPPGDVTRRTHSSAPSRGSPSEADRPRYVVEPARGCPGRLP